MVRLVSWGLLAGLVISLAACGGDSKNNGGGDSTDSTSGSSSNGSGGSGGNGGSDASGGGAGETNSGSGTTTSDSGGSGGTGGGEASGGAAGADSGSGGGGGGPDTIALCPEECERRMAAECPDYTQEQCESDCRFITRLPDCQSEYQAYFDCADGRTAECNAEGNPHVPQCDLQLGIALLCALATVPNQSLEPKCDDYCATVEATCDDERPDCSLNCQTLGTEGTGCDDLWEEHLDCVAEASDTSCPLGIFAAGCGGVFAEYLACVAEGP